MRPRRCERYSGDDRQHGQAERVSAAGSPSLRIGFSWASRQSHHTGIGRIRSRRLARRAAHGTHEVWMSKQPRKSPVHSVIQSHGCPLLEPVRLPSPAMTSYQAFLTKASLMCPSHTLKLQSARSSHRLCDTSVGAHVISSRQSPCNNDR